MDTELAIEALTYAWREHCGAVGEDTGHTWPADESVAKSLLERLKVNGYTVVPIAEVEAGRALCEAAREYGGNQIQATNGAKVAASVEAYKGGAR